MPVHDWSRADDGMFHQFHLTYVVRLCDRLNTGLLPDSLYATLERRWRAGSVGVTGTEAGWYVRLANRVAVRTAAADELVAVFELAVPGHKSSRPRLRRFVGRCCRRLRDGVHVTLVDLHAPTGVAPDGLHAAVWGEMAGEPHPQPDGKPFTAVAYAAADGCRAYVEPVGLGDRLPDMPLFLAADSYLTLPLGSVYADTWAAFPARWKRVIGPPAEGGA